MSRISARKSRRPAAFTLVELMIGMSLAFIVIAGILSAFLFLGRNLTRLINLQQQEVKSRRALQQFTSDVSSAIQFSVAAGTQMVLTVQSSTSNPDTVTYTYTAGAANTGTLTRAATPFGGSTTTTTLLTGLSAFNFNFYSESGTATTSLASIKSAEFSFTSTLGTAASGTQTTYTTVSARVLLRNKPALL